MAFAVADRVKELTTSSSTGSISLDGAPDGYQTFAAGVGGGNVCHYALQHRTEDEWEVGVGTLDGMGTTLARSLVLASSSAGATVDLSAGTKDVWVTLPAAALPNALPAPGGRLTGVSGVPISESDNTNLSTVYYCPFSGNRIDLWNGHAWQPAVFAELSLSLAFCNPDEIYDVFGYFSDVASGSVALELSSAWMSDTSRTDAVSGLNGVIVQDSDNTRRLLGTIRICSGGAYTEDSRSRRFIWNMYNRAPRSLRIYQASNWTYSSTTTRQAAGDTDNQIEVVAGVAGEPVFLSLYSLSQIGTAGHYSRHGWGVNTLSSFTRYGFNYASAANGYGNSTVALSQPQQLGYSVYYWLEQGSSAAGTVTITNHAGAYSGAEGLWSC